MNAFRTFVTALVVCAAPAQAWAASVAGEPVVHWNAPTSFVVGAPFEVEVTIESPEGGSTFAAWMTTAAAFQVDGKALAQRQEGGSLAAPAGFKLSGRVDLGSYLPKSGTFKLAYSGSGEPIEVNVLEQAPSGLDFMQMPVADLSKYMVLLETNRGNVLLKMWPDVAPNHVRNFMDLAYSQFYDATTFHRVIKEFMIQGGDRTGTGTGSGPRNVSLEASDKPHLAGVLSMARSNDPNSASCQFFIVHKAARHLDGQYSAFGEVASGMDTVDRIATTATGSANKPLEAQTILRALVVLAPR